MCILQKCRTFASELKRITIIAKLLVHFKKNIKGELQTISSVCVTGKCERCANHDEFKSLYYVSKPNIYGIKWVMEIKDDYGTHWDVSINNIKGKKEELPLYDKVRVYQ